MRVAKPTNWGRLLSLASAVGLCAIAHSQAHNAPAPVTLNISTYMTIQIINGGDGINLGPVTEDDIVHGTDNGYSKPEQNEIRNLIVVTNVNAKVKTLKNLVLTRIGGTETQTVRATVGFTFTIPPGSGMHTGEEGSGANTYSYALLRPNVYAYSNTLALNVRLPEKVWTVTNAIAGTYQGSVVVSIEQFNF